MRTNLKDFKHTLMAILSEAVEEKVVGPIKLSVSMSGNKEPMEPELQREARECMNKLGFIYDRVDCYHDDDGYEGRGAGFTKVIIKCYDKSTIIEYINYLHKREKVRTNPKQMISAFNKAIMIADDFNNRFGEGNYNKTKEIQEIDEVFKLMQNITGNGLDNGNS